MRTPIQHALTEEARRLLRERPSEFVQDQLTDGPVAQRIVPGWSLRRGGRQLDLFDAIAPERPLPNQQELFDD